MESLPLDDASRAALVQKTTGAREFRARLKAIRQIELPECDRPPGGPPRSVPADRGTPLDEWIATRTELGVSGSVVAVVDGWTTATSQAAQLVYVRVESVLHNEGVRFVAEGDLVSYLQYAGDFRVYGERLCTRTHPDKFLAYEGDTLLLAGTPRPHDDTAMSPSVVFPVLAGLIYPVANANVPWSKPIPLSELMDRIRIRERGGS